MYSLIFLGGAAFLISLALTPAVRDIFLRFGFVDQPDHRKHHARALPRVGGIPIAMAFILPIGLLLLLPAGGRTLVLAGLPQAVKLLPAIILIFSVGIVDDIRGLRPLQKLVGQAAGALLAVWGGVEINSVAGLSIPAWFGIPVTILWLLTCTNAFNLIDGVDGLATGVGLFASTTTLVWALNQDRMDLALVTVPLVGSLLGFLRYNFNPASIFLGDSGSLFIGFLLGCYAVLWSQKSVTLLGMAAPLMVLAIPLLDTSLAVVRRFLRRQPILGADREHIHHRLLARGFTPKAVTLILYGTCGVGAMFAILASFLKDQFAGLLIALFCAGVWIGVRHLHYVEFRAASSMLIASSFRKRLHYRLELDRVRLELQRAENLDDFWDILTKTFRTFGFQAVTFQTEDRIYQEGATTVHGERPGWCIRILLPQNVSIELRRNSAEISSTEFGATAYADAVSDILAKKLRPDVAVSSALAGF